VFVTGTDDGIDSDLNTETNSPHCGNEDVTILAASDEDALNIRCILLVNASQAVSQLLAHLIP